MNINEPFCLKDDANYEAVIDKDKIELKITNKYLSIPIPSELFDNIDNHSCNLYNIKYVDICEIKQVHDDTIKISNIIDIYNDKHEVFLLPNNTITIVIINNCKLYKLLIKNNYLLFDFNFIFKTWED